VNPFQGNLLQIEATEREVGTSVIGDNESKPHVIDAVFVRPEPTVAMAVLDTSNTVLIYSLSGKTKVRKLCLVIFREILRKHFGRQPCLLNRSIVVCIISQITFLGSHINFQLCAKTLPVKCVFLCADLRLPILTVGTADGRLLLISLEIEEVEEGQERRNSPNFVSISSLGLYLQYI
jgi:hypothetical protein